MTASDAKIRLGEVLASLAVQGPVEITRDGRPVAILSAAQAGNTPKPASHLAALAALYGAGAVSWRRIADETGVSFGELLVELGRQGLQLPQATAEKRPAQLAIFEEALARAKLSP